MAYYDRLKEGRTAKKMTQQQLATKIGMAKSTLTNYENGVREPSVEVLGRLMEALDIDANYLFQDEMSEQSYTETLSNSEYPVIQKYRRLTAEEQARIDKIIDDTLSGGVILDSTTQKKPTPYTGDELLKTLYDDPKKMELARLIFTLDNDGLDRLQNLIDIVKNGLT